jgi:hypothetical protein
MGIKLAYPKSSRRTYPEARMTKPGSQPGIGGCGASEAEPADARRLCGCLECVATEADFLSMIVSFGGLPCQE